MIVFGETLPLILTPCPAGLDVICCQEDAQKLINAWATCEPIFLDGQQHLITDVQVLLENFTYWAGPHLLENMSRLFLQTKKDPHPGEQGEQSSDRHTPVESRSASSNQGDRQVALFPQTKAKPLRPEP